MSRPGILSQESKGLILMSNGLHHRDESIFQLEVSMWIRCRIAGMRDCAIIYVLYQLRLSNVIILAHSCKLCLLGCLQPGQGAIRACWYNLRLAKYFAEGIKCAAVPDHIVCVELSIFRSEMPVGLIHIVPKCDRI